MKIRVIALSQLASNNEFDHTQVKEVYKQGYELQVLIDSTFVTCIDEPDWSPTRQYRIIQRMYPVAYHDGKVEATYTSPKVEVDDQAPPLIISVNKDESIDSQVHVSKSRPAIKHKYVLVPTVPTKEQNEAARDWSYNKYGKPIGDDAAEGCYQTMINASPSTFSISLSRSVSELKAALADRTKPFRANHSEVKGLVDYYEAHVRKQRQNLNWINSYLSDTDELEAAIEWLSTQELKINVGPIQQDEVDEYVESTAGWLLRLVKTMSSCKQRRKDYEDAITEAYTKGVNDSIAVINKQATAYDHEHGWTDNETGTREHSESGSDYLNILDELQGDIGESLLANQLLYSDCEGEDTINDGEEYIPPHFNPDSDVVVPYIIPSGGISEEVKAVIVKEVTNGLRSMQDLSLSKEQFVNQATTLVKEVLAKHNVQIVVYDND